MEEEIKKCNLRAGATFTYSELPPIWMLKLALKNIFQKSKTVTTATKSALLVVGDRYF
jgi:hypothetical protein